MSLAFRRQISVDSSKQTNKKIPNFFALRHDFSLQNIAFLHKCNIQFTIERVLVMRRVSWRQKQEKLPRGTLPYGHHNTILPTALVNKFPLLPSELYYGGSATNAPLER
jgi:hypothetical protein